MISSKQQHPFTGQENQEANTFSSQPVFPQPFITNKTSTAPSWPRTIQPLGSHNAVPIGIVSIDKTKPIRPAPGLWPDQENHPQCPAFLGNDRLNIKDNDPILNDAIFNDPILNDNSDEILCNSLTFQSSLVLRPIGSKSLSFRSDDHSIVDDSILSHALGKFSFDVLQQDLSIKQESLISNDHHSFNDLSVDFTFKSHGSSIDLSNGIPELPSLMLQSSSTVSSQHSLFSDKPTDHSNNHLSHLHQYSVLKVLNFPWEVTKEDLLSLFIGYSITKSRIHIPIDKANGKTRNEAFIQLDSPSDLSSAITSLNKRLLKGRQVILQSSSATELFNTHFPQATPSLGIFLTREEMASINNICRNYKLHFSRKCAQRPFEHVSSILYLYPWRSISVSTRDLLFEMVKQTVECLIGHLGRSLRCISTGTLEELLLAIDSFPVFTDKQKQSIQAVAMVSHSRNMLDAVRTVMSIL